MTTARVPVQSSGESPAQRASFRRVRHTRQWHEAVSTIDRGRLECICTLSAVRRVCVCVCVCSVTDPTRVTSE